MNIALLNTRITFQKSTSAIDDVGNHKLEWQDVYTCAATLAGESGNESFIAGMQVAKVDCTFTVRWSSEVARIKSDTHRIICDGTIFDIISVDHMSNTRKCVKFKCTKEGSVHGKD